MAEEDDDKSFKNKGPKEKLTIIVSMTLFIVVVVGFVMGIFLFGFAGLFELMGVHYHSKGSLLLFVVSFFILGFFLDLFVEAIAAIIAHNVAGKVMPFMVQFLFGSASNWFVLVIVDAFMDSIHLSLQTKLLVSLIIGFFEAVFTNEKKKPKQAG